ncbi:pyridoxal phosphate-dependent aminotransferase [Arsenicibacter rosenii]|uniref:Aminotransferase class I/II n=1 Tax=Arsenicibacter rosenii TaxID=1750698 RepID=A0A1S2VEQ9_9BACT|nr:aminotransferase class I/II-fold pyridoxal phosphate-dependent enzyme [Arsenicibacter rosenii]OIN57199.1 aminotransferase class I/II [Arsenicibacter rosenii]
MNTNSPISRRDWLRSSGLLAASLPALANLTPAMANALPSTEASAAMPMVDEFAPLQTGAMPKLKARLFANENPLGISQKAREALIKAIDIGNRYAWEEFDEMKKLIADKEGVKPENIMLTPGSSEVLLITAMHFAANSGTVVTSRPTYDDLLDKTEVFKGRIVSVPLTKTYQYDLAAMKAKINADTKLAYICNPNNPTGTIVPPADLAAFAQEVSPTVPVFIDEAYIDFLEPGDRPQLGKLVAEGKNVMLARTFSKIHGFAGIRLGYVIAQPDMLKTLEKYTTGEFGISIATLMAGIASFKDLDWQNHCRTENARAREYTTKALTEMGYEVIPSYTNFMLFPIRMKPKTFEGQMFANGVGIQTRTFGGQSWCRVSIGTMDEMKTFVDAFKKVTS